jgi:hypothetical protein
MTDNSQLKTILLAPASNRLLSVDNSNMTDSSHIIKTKQLRMKIIINKIITTAVKLVNTFLQEILVMCWAKGKKIKYNNDSPKNAARRTAPSCILWGRSFYFLYKV